MRKLPDFRYEKRLWRKGYKVIVGLDEVGRGAWAGPLVVGAVAFPFSLRNLSCLGYLESLGINDSKKLLPRKREKLSEIIKDVSLAWAVAEVPVSIINRLGMGKTTQVGFRKAVKELRAKLGEKIIDYVLIDAFYISRLTGLPQGKGEGKLALAGKIKKGGRQLAIIDGDQKSISIAAASIIAKVYRDKLMQQLSRKYRVYGWGRNKGYGTAEHQTAIRRYNITRWHRKQFVKSGLTN